MNLSDQTAPDLPFSHPSRSLLPIFSDSTLLSLLARCRSLERDPSNFVPKLGREADDLQGVGIFFMSRRPQLPLNTFIPFLCSFKRKDFLLFLHLPIFIFLFSSTLIFFSRSQLSLPISHRLQKSPIISFSSTETSKYYPNNFCSYRSFRAFETHKKIKFESLVDNRLAHPRIVDSHSNNPNGVFFLPLSPH